MKLAAPFLVILGYSFKVFWNLIVYFVSFSLEYLSARIVFCSWFIMSGNVSPKEVSIENLKEEIHALLCTVKGSVPSDQLLSNILKKFSSFLPTLNLIFLKQMFHILFTRGL